MYMSFLFHNLHLILTFFFFFLVLAVDAVVQDVEEVLDFMKGPGGK